MDYTVTHLLLIIL